MSVRLRTARCINGAGITAKVGSKVGVTVQKVNGIHMSGEKVSTLVENGITSKSVIWS